MPIKRTKTMTRKETTAPFFKPRLNLVDYIQAAYVDTGKIVSLERVADATGLLSVQTLTVFKDEESKQEYDTDPEIILIQAAQDDHNALHDIVQTITIETI
jgi:hypothetical protein